jgi:hypothetical protein
MKRQFYLPLANGLKFPALFPQVKWINSLQNESQSYRMNQPFFSPTTINCDPMFPALSPVTTP